MAWRDELKAVLAVLIDSRQGAETKPRRAWFCAVAQMSELPGVRVGVGQRLHGGWGSCPGPQEEGWGWTWGNTGAGRS